MSPLPRRPLSSWAYAAACVVLAAGFLALAAWSLKSGVAAGKYGAAERSAAPGAYWFFLWMNVFMAGLFLGWAAKEFVPRFRMNWVLAPGFTVMLPLGAWTAIELAGAFARMVRDTKDLADKAVIAVLACLGLGVLGNLLYTLVWPEVKERLEGKDDDED